MLLVRLGEGDRGHQSGQVTAAVGCVKRTVHCGLWCATHPIGHGRGKSHRPGGDCKTK